MNIRIIVASLALAAFTLGGASVANAQSTAPSLTSGPFTGARVDEAALREQFARVTVNIIREWLDSGSGRVSNDSLVSYQMLVGLASRQGVRLEPPRLRAEDEQSLAPALLMAVLSRLKLTHEYSYNLRLQPSVTP